MKASYKRIYAAFLVAAFLSVVGSASAAATYTLQGTLAHSSGDDPLSFDGQAFTATVTLSSPTSTNTTSSQSTATYTGVTSLALSAGDVGPVNCGGAGANMTITDNVTGDDQVQFGSCFLSLSSWSGSIQIEGGGIVTPSPAEMPLTDATGGQVAYSVLGNVTIFNVQNATLSATGASAPNITANPTSFSPTVTEGSTTVQQQVLDLGASSPVSYAVSKTGGAWLSFTPSTGNTSSDITISANPSGLSAGVYNGSVTVNSGQGTPAVIPVTLTVEAFVPPVLSANPTSLTFNYELGGAAPSSQMLNVSATSAASFTVSSSASWLQVSPLSETTPESLTVSINTAGLSAGTLNGSVTITSGTASNSPLVVPVTLNVTEPPPDLSLNPAALSFDYQLLGPAPASKTFDVSAEGESIAYTLSVSDPWLSATPNGTTPQTVTVSVNTASLTTPGTVVGSVTVTAAGAGNSPRVLPVTVNVAAAPNLQAAPSALSFSYQIGASNPASQQIAVSAGGQTIPFSVSTSGGGWLSAVGGGTTPGSITVSVDPSGLAENTYNGSVTVTSAQAANSPLVVNVSFTVSAQPTISASPGELSFTHQIGSSAPSAQMVNLSGLPGGDFTASAASAGNWLSVTPTAGTSPAQLSISVDPAGLAAGAFAGTVTVDAPGAANTPLVLDVTLTVSDQPTISVTPGSLSFAHQIGANAPSARSLSLAGFPGGDFTASAASSGNWLSVTPAAGTSPGQLSVSVDPTGLAAGQFTGSVTITAAGAANSPLVVNVTLTVTPDTPSLTANPAQLLFSHQLGAADPAPQQIAVAAGSAAIPFSVALSDASWATLASTGGTTPRAISVSVDASGLAPGVYETMASITSSEAGNSPLMVPIKLSVVAQPTFTSEAVVNAASFVPGLPSAVGSLASVFGLFPGTVFEQASAIPLPLDLSDVGITLNQDPPAGLTPESGVRRQSVSVVAPLLFVSDQQINFQLPWEIQPGTAQMVVTVGGLASAPVDVQFESTSPAVFTLDYGPGRAIAFMTDGALAQPVDSIEGLLTRPARIGEPLTIFATGLGPLTGPPMASGDNSLDEQGNYVLRETISVPQVFVGGQEAVVTFSGASPEFVGVYQINLMQVPEGVEPGMQVPLVIQLGDLVSREDVSIAVEASPATTTQD